MNIQTISRVLAYSAASMNTDLCDEGNNRGNQKYSGLGKMPEGLLHPVAVDEKFTLGDYGHPPVCNFP